jgi:hypothetical protein
LVFDVFLFHFTNCDSYPKQKKQQQQQEVNSLAVEKSVRMELFAASGKCLKSPTRAVDSMTVAEERKKKMRERRKRREEMR